MGDTELSERLSRISTQWTMILQAHGGSADEPAKARNRLLLQYAGAVYRYLLGAVRDPDVAADLAQEFALRFVRGDFRRADRERGRFRDYVKTAVAHLVKDHYRARQSFPRPLSDVDEPFAATPPGDDTETCFLDSWREELLERTWKALADDNPTYHAVLLLRVDEPDLSSPQMAERLSATLDRPLTADGVRKTLERAQKKFAELLVAEVAASLGPGHESQLASELRDLDLLKYCQSALERRADDGAG
jgi:DNA-directed RNA polymerase specialized sigma24 family protein